MSKSTAKSWLPHSPRNRRILAIGILLLAVVVLIAAIAIPVILLNRHYDENLARMTRQWKSQTAFNELRPKVTRALEELKAKDPRKLFLKGTTGALATAELQDYVGQVIEASGGRLLLRNVTPHKDDGAYRNVTGNFQLNISNANLRRMLHALESKEPYLFDDTLVIRSQTPFGYRPPAGTPEPDLFVQMDVSAVAYVGAETPPAAAGTSGASGTVKPASGGKP